MSFTSHRIEAALRFAAKHLGVSALVAALCAALVFGLWYPFPYSELASGRQLFALVITVDVIVGPLLSLFVYNPAKRRRELWRDLGVIFLVQLCALAYGMYSVTQARPVWLAFEGDRFRVVAVPDLDLQTLHEAPAGLRKLSWTGPRPVGVRLLDSSDPAYPKSLMQALEGFHPAFRPERWVEFDVQRPIVIREAKPLAQLKRKRQDGVALIDAAVRKSGLSEGDLGYLPLLSEHRTDWSVVVSLRDGTPMDYLPLDAW